MEPILKPIKVAIWRSLLWEIEPAYISLEKFKLLQTLIHLCSRNQIKIKLLKQTKSRFKKGSKSRKGKRN